jgi:hypothetical protein
MYQAVKHLQDVEDCGELDEIKENEVVSFYVQFCTRRIPRKYLYLLSSFSHFAQKLSIMNKLLMMKEHNYLPKIQLTKRNE